VRGAPAVLAGNPPVRRGVRVTARLSPIRTGVTTIDRAATADAGEERPFRGAHLDPHLPCPTRARLQGACGAGVEARDHRATAPGQRHARQGGQSRERGQPRPKGEVHTSRIPAVPPTGCRPAG
jgi:hypothetical protein